MGFLSIKIVKFPANTSDGTVHVRVWENDRIVILQIGLDAHFNPKIRSREVYLQDIKSEDTVRDFKLEPEVEGFAIQLATPCLEKHWLRRKPELAKKDLSRHESKPNGVHKNAQHTFHIHK